MGRRGKAHPPPTQVLLLSVEDAGLTWLGAGPPPSTGPWTPATPDPLLEVVLRQGRAPPPVLTPADLGRGAGGSRNAPPAASPPEFVVLRGPGGPRVLLRAADDLVPFLAG